MQELKPIKEGKVREIYDMPSGWPSTQPFTAA